jgi:dUTP pyrophosphatase
MTTFTNLLFNRTDKFMLLKIFVADNELKQSYVNIVNTHNNRVLNTYFYDAGFDLVTPTGYSCAEGVVTKINFQVKCAAEMVYDTGRQYPIGFHVYPRSSLSNTPLRLANSVGIIDSGYRGDLIGAFDCNTSGSQYLVLKHDKLVQICAPGLVPIIVELVNTLEQLGETARGEGGFGSTGR